ncbi:YceI family protein [Polyangium aurulentum]|uniref:YceI family protein n=1 Tax=Polyangium aurulentum TaxID=2567896 RepID=UPI0010ADD048|nr:YceI family protein [Polyangium aurulentum]UQA57555.1 YceI family protein [Polyangium aurulentum]
MSIVRFARIALPAALLLSLAACADPTADKPKATVTTPTPATTQAAATTPAGVTETAAIDAATSSIGFVGSKVTGSHEGKFEKFSGTLSLADGKAEGGKLTIEADVSSVKTDAADLDKHLKAPDFFDVEKFPKATFSSSSIKAGGEKGATHTVTGELDLHGVKKTISFPATITTSPDAVTGTAEFSINRKDFGIAYAGKTDDLIRDDVLLKLNLKAPRKKG